MSIKKLYSIYWSGIVATFLINFPSVAQEINPIELDIPQEIIEDSPVLQDWLQETSDILEDIYRDPSFETHLKVGLTVFPSNDDAIGFNIAIEDIFISRTSLTLSTDYYSSFNGDRVALGANLHYFLFPLGNYINIAPLLGYRYIKTDDYSSNGINGGIRLILGLSRIGAGNISLSQSFVAPSSKNEVGITSLSASYAFARDFRLSTDIELQNSKVAKDNRFSLNFELLF